MVEIFKSESTENFKSAVDQMLIDTQASIDCKHNAEQLQVLCVDVKLWPLKKQLLAPEAKIKLPQQLNTIFDTFFEQYKLKFKAKLVQPCVDLGMCILLANITKSKKFELETTPIQAMVLLQFTNLKTRVSAGTIQKVTNLTAEQVTSTIASLSLPSLLLLK